MKLKILNIPFALFAFLGLQIVSNLSAQPVPGKDENIPFLVTFGKEGKTSWGDDDFNEIFFFTIPKDFKQQFYIRVFDPDCGGEHDEIQGDFNSKTLFSVYGGKGVDPDKNEDSKGLLNGVNYKTGNMLASRVFGSEAKYDNKYYSFGPFNPTEGDFNEKWNAYIFKIICEGVSGDDGNLYRYFLSRDANNNLAIEGANAFTYEYTFRMWNDFKSVAHIYPYIDTGIVFVKQSNFDWDLDGKILVVSKYKQGIVVPISNENDWAESKIPIEIPEVGSSLDFQFHKRQGELVKNNNVVVKLENQRGDALQFYSSPIGGVPVYQPKTNITKITQKK
ncbi:MAG TPA: hypothetical protein PLR88_10485 [Bacteroidales bacterium]|nr:hypothetical protein [Bacteroidales bacterium]HPT22364.1 hypothetical protein [Bacteroidales bacterium]